MQIYKDDVWELFCSLIKAKIWYIGKVASHTAPVYFNTPTPTHSSNTGFDTTAAHPTICDIINMWTAATAGLRHSQKLLLQRHMPTFEDIHWSICLNIHPGPFSSSAWDWVTIRWIITTQRDKKDSWSPAERAGWACSPEGTLGCLYCMSLYCQQYSFDWLFLREEVFTSDTKCSNVSTVLSTIKQTDGMRELSWAQQ